MGAFLDVYYLNSYFYFLNILWWILNLPYPFLLEKIDDHFHFFFLDDCEGICKAIPWVLSAFMSVSFFLIRILNVTHLHEMSHMSASVQVDKIVNMHYMGLK